MPLALALLALLLPLQPDRTPPAVPPAPRDTITADHYRVYRADGTPTTLDALVQAMDTVEVVFVGEQHDDPVAHLLQATLLERAWTRQQAATDGRPVALSLEMFSRDVQPILDEYLAGLITEPHFLASSRPWNNYETDYRPMVEFARAHEVPVVAANAPRRYVNRVARLGPDALTDLGPHAHEALAPLPYAGPSDAYRAKWNRLMQEAMAAAPHGNTNTTQTEETAHPEADEPAPTHGDEAAEDAGDASAHGAAMHGGPSYLLEAQSLWDATMAHSIARHLMRQPGALVLHVVGGFHVEEDTGTPEHLRRYRPGTRTLVVAVRPHEAVDRFDPQQFAGLGDFVILTDAGLPRSYDAGM